MKKAICLAILITLTGCASYHTALINDKGQSVSCNYDGSGVVGSAIAAARHSSCVDDYVKLGYKEQQPTKSQ